MAQRVVEPVISTLPGHPTAAIPGITENEFVSLARPFRSRLGHYWVMLATIDVAPAQARVVVRGNTQTGALQTVVVEDVTSIVAGETVDLIDATQGVNESGAVALGINTSAPTASDEVIVRWSGGTFTVVAREGQPVPALLGLASYGTSSSSVSITDAGAVAFATNLTGPLITTDTDTALLLASGTVLAAQEGLTVPLGQAGGGLAAWDLFATDAFFVDASGTRWLARGTLETDPAFNAVTVVSNTVRVQEGVPLPGVALPTAADTPVFAAFQDPSGPWTARGANTDTRDWVIRGTNVLALGDSGFPVAPGESDQFTDQVFDQTFYFLAALGPWNVVAGRTNNPNPRVDTVAVLGGATVVLREGDPVDLDLNGALDDDAEVGAFTRTDAAFLTAGGWLYFVSELRTNSGALLGECLCRVRAACQGDLTGDLWVDDGDLGILLDAWGPGSGGDLNFDGVTNDIDLGLLLDLFGKPCAS